MSQDNVEIVRRAYSLAKESETYSFVAAKQDLYDEYFHHDLPCCLGMIEVRLL